MNFGQHLGSGRRSFASVFVLANSPGVLGQPFSAGDTIWVQAWFRDPPSPKTTNLSNGLEFTLQP